MSHVILWGSIMKGTAPMFLRCLSLSTIHSSGVFWHLLKLKDPATLARSSPIVCRISITSWRVICMTQWQPSTGVPPKASEPEDLKISARESSSEIVPKEPHP